MISHQKSPIKQRYVREKNMCMCCVKCKIGVIVVSLILIAIASILLFTSFGDNFTDNRESLTKISVILMITGILIFITAICSLIIVCRTFMNYEQRINNPEPFVAPKSGYPKQQYE